MIYQKTKLLHLTRISSILPLTQGTSLSDLLEPEVHYFVDANVSDLFTLIGSNIRVFRPIIRLDPQTSEFGLLNEAVADKVINNVCTLNRKVKTRGGCQGEKGRYGRSFLSPAMSRL